ncbi:hypothetical protein GQ457_18G000430 [Hibiscus cannabinus]
MFLEEEFQVQLALAMSASNSEDPNKDQIRETDFLRLGGYHHIDVVVGRDKGDVAAETLVRQFLLELLVLLPEQWQLIVIDVILSVFDLMMTLEINGLNQRAIFLVIGKIRSRLCWSNCDGCKMRSVKVCEGGRTSDDDDGKEKKLRGVRVCEGGGR